MGVTSRPVGDGGAPLAAGAPGASPANPGRGDNPLVPAGAAGASPANPGRGDTPLVPPGAAGASPANPGRGDTPPCPPGGGVQGRPRGPGNEYQTF